MAIEKTIEFFNENFGNYLRFRKGDGDSIAILIAEPLYEEYEGDREDVQKFLIESKEDFLMIRQELDRLAEEIFGF